MTEEESSTKQTQPKKKRSKDPNAGLIPSSADQVRDSKKANERGIAGRRRTKGLRGPLNNPTN